MRRSLSLILLLGASVISILHDILVGALLAFFITIAAIMWTSAPGWLRLLFLLGIAFNALAAFETLRRGSATLILSGSFWPRVVSATAVGIGITSFAFIGASKLGGF